MNIRTNHPLRLEAYDELSLLKKTEVSRKECLEIIHSKYKIPIGTLYDWYKGRKLWGRKGSIEYNPELLYVLGALLGDGCSYKWKPTNNWNILVGDYDFTYKYAKCLNKCSNKIVKPYIDRSKNIWFVKSNNYELFQLFQKSRQDLSIIESIIQKQGRVASLLFLEGFFDAEGCVKIIKERVRKTPKICLDIANTDYEILALCRRLFRNTLGIEARFSIQEPKSLNRKVCYYLRIYKKQYIRKFFEEIHTTKLSKIKMIHLEKWLNNGK